MDYPSTDHSVRLATGATIPRLRFAIVSTAKIGSIRQDCLDHVVVFGERHLRHLLKPYQTYYNGARTHLSLHKDAPIPRAVQAIGHHANFGWTAPPNMSECEFPTGTASSS